MKFLRGLAAASILGIGVSILTYAMSSSNAANRDFISYWAAGKQLIHHANPYDGPVILGLERGAGFTDPRPFFMRNPPLAFFITLPVALFSAKAGAILWSIAIIAALMVSIRLIWKMHGQPKDSLHLTGYMFPPALACLLAGQIGIFLLLSVVLFLYFYETRPYFAGSSLLLCALKPHLFIPLAIALLVWSVANKTYRVLLGASVAIGCSLLLSYFIDPAGWSQYAHMVNTAGLRDEFIPTLSLMFRLLIHRSWIWLQIIPAVIGAAWAVWFFWKNRDKWDWRVQGMSILLVSVMVAPYAWFSDEAVLLPAILASLYAGRSLIPYVIVAGIALIEVMAGLPMTTPFYLWTTPAWLLWYLWACFPNA